MLNSNKEGGLLLTAVEKLQEVYEDFPSWVQESLTKKEKSQIILNDTGTTDNTTSVDANEVNMAMRETEAEENDQGAELDDFTELYYGGAANGDDEDTDNDETEATTNGDRRVGIRDFTKYNVSKKTLNHYNTFIREATKAHKTKIENDNKIPVEDLIKNPFMKFNFTDHAMKEAKLNEMLGTLNDRQLQAFNIVKLKFQNTPNKNSNTNNEQSLIMLMSGQGGTGKSYVIKCLYLLAQIWFGKTVGSWGPMTLMAPTGSAAYNINGHTWQSKLGKSREKKTDKEKNTSSVSRMSASAISNLVKNAKGCKAICLDEISLCSLETIYEIHQRCCIAFQCKNKPFGGVHIIFSGDFYQMQCINGVDIPTIPFGYTTHKRGIGNAVGSNAIEGYKLWQKLNAFVELEINVRAASEGKELTPLAFFNENARLANFENPNVLATMNQRVGNSLRQILKGIDETKTPIVYICDTHKKITEVNNLFLARAIKQKIQIHRVIATHHPTRSSVPVADKATLNFLYSITGGAGAGKRNETPTMASFIDMFVGQRVRVDRNLSIPLGIYNGAMGTVVGFIYEGPTPDYIKKNEHPPRNFSNLKESQRKPPIVLIQLDYPDKFEPPYTCVNDNKVRNVYPFTLCSCLCSDTGDQKYTRMQVPLLVAHGRTSHSTQGMTFYCKVIVDPNNRFFAGIYVSISRATEIENVHLISPLTEHMFSNNDEFRILVDAEYKRLRILFPQVSNIVVVPAKLNTCSSSKKN